MITFLSSSPQETKRLARLFLTPALPSSPLIFALSGSLGAGKTCFVQGLAKFLGIKEKVISPSFVIIKSFPLPASKPWGNKKVFWHIDCWRLEKKDLIELGLKEILTEPENIVCLEWAEKVKELLPPGTLWLEFEFLDPNKRRITLKN